MNAKPKFKSSCSSIVRPVVVLASTLILLWSGIVRAEHDITSPGDVVESFLNDNGLPSAGHPALVIDDNINTSCYLEFKGGTRVTGFRVKPSVGPTVVTGLSFTAAGNAPPERDPVAFELCGSNMSIDGPYELIVSGNIVDFAQESAWPRRTKNKTPILFDNSIAYTYYQVLFTDVRGQWSVGGVQIAEVELLATVLQATSPEPINGSVVLVVPQLQWLPGETAVSHDLYFGTNPEPGQAEYISRLSTNIYYPAIEFKPGTTYYWRVDEVEADGTIHTGTVWNFTFTAKAINPDPANRAVDVKLPLLQWTVGDATASYNVYYGDDLELVREANESVLAAKEWPHNFYFPGSDFRAGVTYYWKINEVKADGTVTPGDVWSFTTKKDRPSDYPTFVAWWPYDEGAGTYAKDLVGLRQGVVRQAEWAPGRDDLALQFNGVDAHVEAPFVRSPADGPLSIFCWVNGNTGGGVIASQQNGVNWLMTNESGHLMTELPSPEVEPVLSSVQINDGDWHHVGVVWDGEFVNLYVDGAVDVSGGSTPAFTFGRFYTGRGSRDNEQQFWQGVIDDVQVYSEALTYEQILDMVTGGMGEIRLAKESVGNIVGDSYQVGLAVGASRTLAIDLNFKGAVGAIAKPGATKSDVNESAAKLGLEVVEFDERSRIVRLALPYDTSRPEVAKFTGAARQTLADSNFAEIGLTVTPTGARSPMILTNKFVVQLKAGASIDDLIGGDPNLIEVEENPYRENQYLIKVNPDAGFDALQASHSYANNSKVVDYAVANFASVPEFHGDSLPVQWHLNDEPNDADIDADKAQELMEMIKTTDVNIAIIDTTVDHQHPDLISNLWKGQGTNNFGYTDNTPHWHGTAVAGCVGANGVVSGSCPNCKLMLLRCNLTNYDQHKAFNFAKDNGADVICCSWGYTPGIDPPVDVNEAIREAAEKGRGGHGCVIVFAMTNEEWDNGNTDPPDISSFDNVIAVSGSNDQNQRSGAGFGDCMEVLAPTSSRLGGTRSIVTTYVDNDDQSGGSCITTEAGFSYTSCFGGTSAACATTAGVAGLILSVDPNLTREQVKYLLQDTADKIEDMNAEYDAIDGFSRGRYDKSTHGYGRINAYEAVRTLAPKTAEDEGGVDIFMRDNYLDWGNTERPSNESIGPARVPVDYWESRDIKIDAPDSNNRFRSKPSDSKAFNDFLFEQPIAKSENRVYVRVHNRGPDVAKCVTVRLYAWTGDNPPKFSLNSSGWQLLEPNINTIEVPYSGCSVAGTDDDHAQIVCFTFTPERGLNRKEDDYYYLLAIAECVATDECSKEDPISYDLTNDWDTNVIVPNDNNITMLRISWSP